MNSGFSAGGGRAIATFMSKGHDLFATLHGRLSIDNNRTMIDRLWNGFVGSLVRGRQKRP